LNIKVLFINTSIEFYRKNKRQNMVDNIDSVAEQSIDSQILSMLKAADLMKLVNCLPTGYRTVFNLYVVEGYTHQEISNMLHISDNTSKSQLHKARLHLQELVLKKNLK
jgi:RNA polymerase sigma factor (sigma-70 family)